MTLLQKIAAWFAKPTTADRIRALEEQTRLARERAARNRAAPRPEFPFAGFAGRREGDGR